MSEVGEDSGGFSSRAEPSKPTSAGVLLRKAREAEGLQLPELALLLKVPVKKIVALESDRWDELPDLTFARALASSMCRALRMNPDPVLSQMPSSFAPPIKPDQSGINSPFKVPGEVAGLTVWRILTKPLVLPVVVLTAGALILLLPVLPPTKKIAEEVVSIADVVPLSLSNVPPVGDDISPKGADVAALIERSISAASADDSSANVVLTPSLSAPTTALVAASPTVDGEKLKTGLLVLAAKEAAWIQVVDSAGVVQVRKTLQAGESVGVSGALPLAVILGRADVVDVQVRGQPFEFATRTKENIARFEVK